MRQPDLSTPAELSREIGISRARIRRYVKERYGDAVRPFAGGWRLSEEQADDVRRAFARGDVPRMA
ncbi:MAG: hypothetical protein J0G30_12565 [Actinomycetales bacterium]|nr:hypothetical protein [Actinomycetales bacterium]